MQASLEKLLEGYEIGFITGDQEYACWNLLSYGGLSLYTGQPLGALEKDLKKCEDILLVWSKYMYFLTTHTYHNILPRRH